MLDPNKPTNPPCSEHHHAFLALLMKAPVVEGAKERFELGMEHDPRSVKIAEALACFDWLFDGDYFDWKFGGDGDNGEQLLYALDVLFAAGILV